jgi:DNA-binding SARP family transcriptional activator/tetratricopeptide (TPR) repeat protein
MDAFRVLVFGPPRLFVGHREIRLATKAFGLLGVLARANSQNRQDRIDRKRLARLLWPTSSDSHARHSLSQCLYSIKKACGTQVPLVGGDDVHVWLCSPRTDIKAFEDSLHRRDPEQAAREFRGPFLLGIDVRGGNDFNDWRDHIRLYYERLAHRVLDSLQVGEHWEAVVPFSQRLLQINPDRESSHKALIRSLSYLGRTHEAEQRLQEARSLGVDLSDDVLMADRAREVCRGPHKTKKIPFVGREEELNLLQTAFKEALEGATRVIILEGEPGIGKTTLIERFLKWTVLKGARAISACGYELERNVPFGIVAQWLEQLPAPDPDEPWAHVINRAFPEAPESDTPEGHDPVGPKKGEPSDITLPRLLESVRRMLLHQATARPVVLSVDDAHFADPASLGLLHYLSRSLGDVPIVQVIGLRTTFPDPGRANTLSEWRDALRISLPPLSSADVRRLLRYPHDESVAGLTADDLLDRTNGNPFLIAALLKDGNSHPNAALPESIIDFLEPRLDRLSGRASAVLNSLAVVGEATQLETLEELAGLRPSDVLGGLRELERFGMTYGDDTGVRLAHGLVGELTLAKLPDSIRRSLFGRAAKVLAAEGQSSAVIAIQHDIAGNAENAFTSALTAAEASGELRAHREREFFLKLALAHAPSAAEKTTILLEIAKLLMDTGRASEALDLLDSEPLKGTQGPAVAAVHRILARIRLSSHVSSAVKEAPAEIARFHPAVDNLLLAKLYTALAAAAHDLGDISISLTYGQKASALARKLSPGPEASRILIKAALVNAAHRGYEEGAAALANLEHIVDDSAESRALFLIGKGLVSIRSGNLTEAERNYLHAVGLCEDSGIYDTLIVVQNNLAVCFIEQGRYEDALIYLRALYTSEDPAPRGIGVVTDNLVQLHYQMGEYQEALDISEGSLARSRKKGRSFFHLHGIRGLSAIELGRIAIALESKREIELALNSSEYWANDMSYVEILLGRMLSLQGQNGAAIERLQSAVDVYKGKDVLCEARIESEIIRYLAKRHRREAAERTQILLRRLSGSGAVPLLENLQGLLARTSPPHPSATLQ